MPLTGGLYPEVIHGFLRFKGCRIMVIPWFVPVTGRYLLCGFRTGLIPHTGRLLFLPSLQCLSSQNSQCIPLALTGCPSPPAHHCTAPAPSLRVSSQRRTCCPGILSGSHRSLCTEFRISIFQRTDRPFLHRD